MRVLGIDPGYDRLGVAVIEKVDGKETVVFSDCVLTDKNAELSARIHELGTAVKELIAAYKPQCVAIETLFFNKNVKTAVAVAEARGVILFLAQEAGCVVHEYGPQEIKVAVTGYGKSDKAAVLDMVKRLARNVPEKALDDEYDAIAVGLTCLVSIRHQ